MMNKCAVWALLIGAAVAQDPCAFDAYCQHLQHQNPGLVLGTSAAGPTGTRLSNGVCRIPVVVHIVWGSPQQNISNAQVMSQIAVLNEDFRRTNADANQTVAAFLGVAADCEIEFCLASVDPSGAPTNGITRRQTTVAQFDPFTDYVKSFANGGQNPWNPTNYLNIWVCNLFPGLLGYAAPPGTPAGQDGVVVAFGQFGRPGVAPFSPTLNAGRTCTHEVGHYLNLLHVWGTAGGCSDDDGVSDTPNCSGPNMGCATNVSTCGTLDMTQNFLDYTDDVCMNLFTQGQKTRMRATLTGARAGLLTSPAACPNPVPEYQVNQFAATLSVNNVLGTASAFALVTSPVGQPVTLSLGSLSQGSPWDLASGVAPLVPASAGAFQTTNSQIVNMDLTDPAFFLWWSGFSSAPFVNTVFTVTPTAAFSTSVQFAVANPALPAGVAISQPSRVVVQ